MEEKNTLKEKLIEKLNAEYAMLRDELRESGIDNFMERCYEYFTKQEIIDYLQYSEISEDSIKLLLKINDYYDSISYCFPLVYLYHSYDCYSHFYNCVDWLVLS